jgi:DNA repair protein RadC
VSIEGIEAGGGEFYSLPGLFDFDRMGDASCDHGQITLFEGYGLALLGLDVGDVVNVSRELSPGQTLDVVSAATEQTHRAVQHARMILRDAILAQSREILLRLASEKGPELSTPQRVREYLIHLLGAEEREHFVMVAVDSRLRLIATEILFSGTVDASAVYPREVVKSALRHNASSIYVGHNHPSCVLEPSQADELITRRLAEALSTVQIRLLDHFVIGGGHAFSFLERGLL